MHSQLRVPVPISGRILAALLSVFAISGSAGISKAVDLIEVKAESVNVAPGTIGAGLNVLVKNNGASAVNIGGFAFQVTVASTKIKFTGITTATTPSYIFAGQSSFGPNIGISNTDQDWSASDIFAIANSGIALQPGQTLGLGYLVFDVAADAAGTYKLVVEPFPGTSLSNFGGDDIPIATVIDGQITAIPEPSSVLLGGCCLIATCAARTKRARRREPSAV